MVEPLPSKQMVRVRFPSLARHTQREFSAVFRAKVQPVTKLTVMCAHLKRVKDGTEKGDKKGDKKAEVHTPNFEALT